MGNIVSHRAIDVNGKLLKYYRQKRGWTQDELAQAARSSARTIRHAEANRIVGRDTLEDIAEALSTTADPLSWVDLSTDQLAVINCFREAYAFGERNLAHLAKHVVAENFQYYGVGDEAIMDYAGHFDGLSEFDRFIQLFYNVYERPRKSLYTQGKAYFCGKDFIVDTQDAGRIRGAKETMQMRVLLFGRIENGKISELHAEIDDEALARYVLANQHLHNSPVKA